MRHTSSLKLALLLLPTMVAVAESQPAEFGPQAKTLLRVVACGGEVSTPAAAETAPIVSRCAVLREAMDLYRRRWLRRATPLLASIVPQDVPKQVVYPFGGGDLLTALATYPEATELTTLSLERAGDPRAAERLEGPEFEASLEASHKRIVHLFRSAHSLTRAMGRAAKRELLPDQLVFALLALAVHGLEPTSLRFFRLESDGSLHYVTDQEVAAGDGLPTQNPAFTNMELVFQAKGHAVTYRHVRANLDNEHLRADPAVLRHLERKGPVAAMTKAASYTLWWPNFSVIRNYLLGHMDWMISDSTGIPPGFACRAGFEYETYGRFTGPFFPNRRKDAAAWRAIWNAQPYRDLPFRYGYPDSAGHSHLVVTRRVPKTTS